MTIIISILTGLKRRLLYAVIHTILLSNEVTNLLTFGLVTYVIHGASDTAERDLKEGSVYWYHTRIFLLRPFTGNTS